MEARRNIERGNHLSRHKYEDSFLSDEELSQNLKDTRFFTSSSDLESSKQERDNYYALKYPSLARLEETCREIEAENKAKADLLDPKTDISSHKSETSYYSSQSTYQANSSAIQTTEESFTSRSFEVINNLLNKNINDTVTTASSYADAVGCPNNPHDSWLHLDSSTANTSLLEIKEVLHQLGNVRVRNLDSTSSNNGRQSYLDRLTKSFEKLPSDFKEQLKTILEETQLTSHDESISAFRDLVLQVIGKTRDLQDETIPFTSDQTIFKDTPEVFPSVEPSDEGNLSKTPMNNTRNKKVYRKTPIDLMKSSAYASTPLRIAALTRGMETPNSDTKSPIFLGSGRDFNESSFTFHERQCLGDDIPKSPKPMPELTEEQKKLLEECRQKELALASVSPFSVKDSKNESREFEENGSPFLTPDSLKAPGRASSNLYDSLDDWDIEKEMAERDKRLAETEMTIKNIVEDKIAGSYSTEFLNVVNNYFDVSNSSRLKSGDGLYDSGVETAIGSRRTDKLSSSDESLDSRMGNVTLRKLSSSSVKKFTRSKSCKSPEMNSRCKATGLMRNKSPSSKRVAVTPKSTPRVLQRTTSAPVTPRVVSARKNISTKFTPSKMSSALSAVASKSVSKVTSKVFKVPANPPMIMVTPNTPTSSSKNFSTFKSPRLEYGGKYFCTPGKAPPKEKRVFFPTPGKKNIPKSNKGDLLDKIYPGSSEVRSPVADYIRGGRDAITIKTIPKLQNEYLLSKEEVLNYKPKKINNENNPPNFEFNFPSAVYQSKKQVQEFDASPVTPQGSRVKKLVAKKDSRAVIKHQIDAVLI
ncbi:Protein of unknown function [Cotesia congregata]|uniref:Uncharacterized protein n=1 Tax=Cotesia congregata TaxID=51543 RepID=A0A8J2MXR1_COTCN|nr:Protein of unknown function [Cotesia congregata]